MHLRLASLALCLVAACPALPAAEPRSPTVEGMVLLGREEPGGALAQFDRALALKPTGAELGEILGYRAKALFMLKRDDEARADLERAIVLQPDNPAHYRNRAVMKSSRDDLAGAISDLTRAIALAADDEQKFDTLDMRAELKSELDDFDGAIADYDAMLKIEPEDDITLGHRGVTHFLAGHTDLALRDFDQSIKLYAGSPGTFYARGNLRSSTGDYAGALADFEKMQALPEFEAENLSKGIWSQREIVLRRLKRGTPFAEAARTIASWGDSFAKTVALYLIESITEADLLRRVGTGTEREQSEQRAAAHYYIGMTRLIAGDASAARQPLERAAAEKKTGSAEYLLARGELARLSPPAK